MNLPLERFSPPRLGTTQTMISQKDAQSYRGRAAVSPLEVLREPVFVPRKDRQDLPKFKKVFCTRRSISDRAIHPLAYPLPPPPFRGRVVQTSVNGRGGLIQLPWA